MPTVTSIGNKKIAMFSTRPEINQAVPILSQQRFQSLALEHSFHSGNSLRSIAHHFDLSADIVTALRSNFAFGLIRFENKVKMFDWLMEQTRLCDREIFGYYRKRGSGYDLLANIGWYSASPFLPERMRTFHTHPSGGQNLSSGDVFNLFVHGKQEEFAVVSITGASIIRRSYPILTDKVGKFLQALSATYINFQEYRNQSDLNVQIREMRFSDIPWKYCPNPCDVNGQKFALQILTQLLANKAHDERLLMTFSGLEIEDYSNGIFTLTRAKPKINLLCKIMQDFYRNPFGNFLKWFLKYTPYDAIEI